MRNFVRLAAMAAVVCMIGCGGVLGQGEQGATGVAGEDGTDGRNGADGVDGTAGRDGVDGAMGLQGEPGEPGQPGAPGRDGTDGAPGSQGEPGADGAPGEPGGEQGPEGPEGPEGPQGEPGEPGEDGEQGPEGPQGPAAEGEGEGEGGEEPECRRPADCNDDGNQCTEAGCVDGECVQIDKNCDDGVDCTRDECVPATGCQNDRDNDNCGAGEQCFAFSQMEISWSEGQLANGCYECQDFGWESIGCDDENPCTVDVCGDNRTCTHEPFCGHGEQCVPSADGRWADCAADRDGDGDFACDWRMIEDCDCDDSNPAIRPGQNEICNDLDDDCDGQADEGVNCAPRCAPVAEMCNRRDDDCDGVADNGFGTGGCFVGTGACRRDGTMACQADGTNACSDPNGRPLVAGAPVAEICADRVDNDCDGAADEADCIVECSPNAVRVCGNPAVGQCRQGSQTCGADSRWGACLGEIRPANEICNALDDDCDNAVDEQLNCAPAPNGGTDQIRECAPGDPLGNWGLSIMGVPNGVIEQATAAGQCVQMDTLTVSRSNLRFNARRPNNGLYCCGTVAGSNVPQDLCPGLQVFRDGVQIAHGSAVGQLQCQNDANGNNYRIVP